MSDYQVTVADRSNQVGKLTVSGDVVVGRQNPLIGDPAPVGLGRDKNQDRLIVASSGRKGVPRNWFRLSCNDQHEIVVENMHAVYAVEVVGSEEVGVGAARTFEGDITIVLGSDRTLSVSPGAEYRSLQSVPATPGQSREYFESASLREVSTGGERATVEMLRTALQVVQTAAGSNEFFKAAVQATVRMVGLDRAIVLMREEADGVEQIAMSCTLPNGWCVVAESLAAGTDPSTCPAVSRNILDRVDGEEIATVIHDPTLRKVVENAASLVGVQCAVASPILNSSGELIGVLYADRWSETDGDVHRISDVEATLVEVLAGAVAGGVARKAEERRRGNLSGFFSPRIADLLAASPKLLQGQDVEVSVLFCDIRGFSGVTEILGPVKTIEWINDVLGELSYCVVETEGVLVDYVGDELMAMWGAPGDQPDHAKRAVETAVQMLFAIGKLREKWADVLPSRFGAGVGVNSGPARVGNVGSKWKFKYGVLGNTVNVGSRLQAATKQLQVDCMVSERTARDAGIMDATRRLAKLNVVGIEEPIDVHQVVIEADESWRTLVTEYQLALTDFEQERFSESTRRLGELIQRYPSDRPCRQLLARAATELNEPSETFSPVWKLSKK